MGGEESDASGTEGGPTQGTQLGDALSLSVAADMAQNRHKASGDPSNRPPSLRGGETVADAGAHWLWFLSFEFLDPTYHAGQGKGQGTERDARLEESGFPHTLNHRHLYPGSIPATTHTPNCILAGQHGPQTQP